MGEGIILAVVAVTTAWSALQAAKWDGRQSLLYGQASRRREHAGRSATVADASMFTAWLQAHAAGDTQLQATYVRRFTPEYRAVVRGVVEDRPLQQSGGTARTRLPALLSQPEPAESRNVTCTQVTRCDVFDRHVPTVGGW
jgi:hypothetical protein